jgi:heavy metal sensor kinase
MLVIAFPFEMKINTFRMRFAIWLVALLLVAFAIFGTFVYLNMSHSIYNAVDDALMLNASELVAGLNIENGQLILAESLIESPASENISPQPNIRIVSPDGKVLQTTGSLSLPLPILTNFVSSFLTWKDPISKQAVRIYSVPVMDNNRMLAIVQEARSLQPEIDTLRRLMTTLLLGSPLLALLAALGGYFLASSALAPIHAITQTARQISAQDLSARLNLPPTDDEVGLLATTFDEMISRLESAFHRERQFVSDASHELRTPLAAMQAILSVTREHPRSPKEYVQALEDLSDETNRLNKLTQDLLLLARGQTNPALFQESIELSILLNDVVETLRPLIDAKGLTLDCHISAGLVLHADRDALIRLFVNLIDNAIKFTEHGGITIKTRAKGDSVFIELSDTGVGIQPEYLDGIFDRFFRADTSRSLPGSGLGLAIALDIAHAHSGDIQVQSELGKGTLFTVRLPRSN